MTTARSASVRRLAAAALVVALCAAIAGQTAPPQTPPDPQRPIFRGGTNLVLVDAYPRRDGHIVEGLTPADFEVLEDGKAQAIDQFEFVRVEPTPEAERRDPNTQQEMLQLASDPHNRVFVLLLDVYHVTPNGARMAKGPLLNMLNRVLAPNDLFGATTPMFPASSLVLGRKLIAVEEQLYREPPWGLRGELQRNSAEEFFFDQCYTLDPTNGELWRANDDGVVRLLPDLLIDRWREDRTLTMLKALVGHLGQFREARTTVIVVTDGWRLFAPDSTIAAQGGKTPAGRPEVGVPPGGGRLGVLDKAPDGLPTSGKCNGELQRLASIDDRRVFLDIVSLANRHNVVFYPVSPGGLDAEPPIPGMATRGGAGAMSQTMSAMDHAGARTDSAISLATETDGLAVVRTNDLRGGMARIINDVSAYYLLGYYSTNPKADGKLRRIKVRVKQPDVAVAARRGYVVATPASVAAKAALTPAAPAGPVVPAGVTGALGVLSRLGAAADVFAAGVVAGPDLAVVVEIASSLVDVGKWAAGGAVRVTVTGPGGDAVGTGTGTIDAGARGALVRVPIGAAGGPWRVAVTVSGKDGTIEESIDARARTGRWLGDPIVYRGASNARAALRPAAEPLFHRTERVHVEVPVLAPIERRGARLLDRRGQPVLLDVTLTERDDAGRAVLAVDLNLAPLAAGDYVLEISAGAGEDAERRYVGMRVVR